MAYVELQEQILNDAGVTGIILTIWRTANGEARIRLTGDLPFSNREFQFDAEGRLVGTGTSVGESCPSHLQLVD
jgi:hypothetical protein